MCGGKVSLPGTREDWPWPEPSPVHQPDPEESFGSPWERRETICTFRPGVVQLGYRGLFFHSNCCPFSHEE